MLQKLKRKCTPATLLLTVGFAISLTSVLVGISTISTLLADLSNAKTDAPIYLTMQNTGLSLALAIYLFSIANCLVVTNYWIVTQRRDMAVRKAFGWSNRHLIGLVISQMAEILAVSLCISAVLLGLLGRWNPTMFSVHFTPLFVLGTLALLLLTLMLSLAIPKILFLKIHPAEVIA